MHVNSILTLPTSRADLEPLEGLGWVGVRVRVRISARVRSGVGLVWALGTATGILCADLHIRSHHT